MRASRKDLSLKAFIVLDGRMKSLLAMCILAVLTAGCAPCDLDSVAHTEQEKRAVFRIVLGEGGGISGTWNGHTITGSGEVSAWSGRGARENERAAGRLPSDTMCVLWDAARTLAATPPADSSGSLVRYLSVTTGDSTRNYTWRPRLGMGQATAPYQEFYDRCSAAIRTSMTQATTTTTSTR
jgi:hypothetical protein